MTQFASLATKLYDQVTETVNERRLEGSTDEGGLWVSIGCSTKFLTFAVRF